MLRNLATLRKLIEPSSRPLLVRSLILGLVVGLLQGAALLFLLPVSTALATGKTSWGLEFWTWVYIIGGLAILSFVAEYIYAMASFRMAFAIMRTFHHTVGDQISRLPLGWFAKGRAGELSQLAAKGIIDIGSLFAHLLPNAVKPLGSLITLMIGSWIWDIRLGLVLTVSAPLLMVVLFGTRKITARAEEPVHLAEVETNDRILEFARAQGALRSCGRSENFPALHEAMANQQRQSKRRFWWTVLANGINASVVQLAVAALITLAAYLALNGTLAPIQALAFIGISLYFSQPLSTMTAMAIGMTAQEPQIKRVQSVVDAHPLPEVAVSNKGQRPGEVRFDKVDFSYQDTPVLRQVSFTARPGQLTALVGPSGSGKTTIARLVSRFYDVDSGTVYVGGVDVRELTTPDLMAQISMVFQDVYLFDDTLESNIALGRDGADRDQVRAAADTAGVTEIVERLPHGWNTRVGEGGTALSGGERQRVSIARALLKQAPIVLLDEATSALDSENEDHIVQAIGQLREHSTVIVIAHKLATIESADTIVVLDDQGRVSQLGTHAELIDQPGIYRDFHAERASARGWQLAT